MHRLRLAQNWLRLDIQAIEANVSSYFGTGKRGNEDLGFKFRSISRDLCLPTSSEFERMHEPGTDMLFYKPTYIPKFVSDFHVFAHTGECENNHLEYHEESPKSET